MKLSLPVLALSIAVTTAAIGRSSTVTTTDFRSIPEAVFANSDDAFLGGSIELPTGSLAVTTSGFNSTGVSFWFTESLEGPDPSGLRIISFIGSFSPGTITLSEPVAAFGLTFHQVNEIYPATLKAYSGANGTGSLIGSIQSVVVLPTWSPENRPVDFVAVWTSSRAIRSVVVEGAGPNRNASISGIAVSLVPLPEPSSFALACFAGLALLRRRR